MTQKQSLRPSTRDAIVDAAILVLGQNPGSAISEIALKAGVGRATLHRHFRTREDLLDAVREQSMNETEQAVIDAIKEDMTALQELEALFTAIIPLGDRYHFLSGPASTDRQILRQYQSELDWIGTLVTKLRADSVVAADIPDTWAISQIDQLVWTLWREVSAGHIAAIDAPKLAIRTFTRGLGR